jgi:adenine-specific DNA-methyltransferase
MSKKILQDIIGDFKIDKFIRFFRYKNRYFRPHRESLNQYDDESFSEGIKLGEVNFDNEAQELIICAFNSTKSLSERSGKKAQYEKAKKILKELDFDSGIFIFYDQKGNFRFSLIYFNYLGKGRHPSTFRRFTYFVSPDLTNKTFLQRIGEGDFSSLEKVKDAFSVEKVTEDFYKDIANWYFWAVQNSRFPKDAEEEENGRNMAVIRLITRLIFIWFMRVRGLVPDSFFNESRVVEYLNDLSPQSSSYYKAILQNLFFATLSTKREERNFRSEIRGIRGYNPDFGNNYTYRYHKLFKNPEKIKDYFGEIPFLNGGIFECLDDKPNGIYIDGFSDTKKNQPVVPNFLFFSGDSNADLNIEYGTKNKNYKVRGIINILSYYNFTIDENDPNDAEVALDPELLGRVFENLLASFNPETSTTARKATGSYYTPREIVDYMVTESLKEYFKTHLVEAQNLDEKLDRLFSTGSDENPFKEDESRKLVELIESVRIIDPAVGSGAFPMGALNKMVFILSKVDSGNELWKQAQLIAAEVIPDPQVRRATKNQIEEFFKDKNADYGRKLYLIQKCIYGVDIQQIAVEIAKLRFFISLLVDEKIDKEKENWGIEPLPNLDFKIMQGNSLISEFLGIDFDNGQAKQEQAGMLFIEKEDKLIKEFEQKKIDFQNEPNKDKKAKLKNEIEDLMIKIFEAKIRKQKADYFRQMEDIEEKYAAVPNKKTKEEIIDKEKRKLSQKAGFDLENIEKQLREFTSKNKTKPFFAWKLYFAEVFKKGGFDIVIGNPPYVSAVHNQDDPEIRKIYRTKYPQVKGAFDLYTVFLLRGLNISNSGAIFSWIIPNKFLVSNYASNVIEELKRKGLKKVIIVSNLGVFKNTGVYPIVILGNRQHTTGVTEYEVENLGDLKTQAGLKIRKKIHSKFKTIKELGLKVGSGTTGFQAQQIKSLVVESKDRSRQSMPFIVSGSIDRYHVKFSDVHFLKKLFMFPYINYKKGVVAESKWSFWENPKIVIAGMTKEIEATYVQEPLAIGIGVYAIYTFDGFDPKYLLALLNSKYLSHFLKINFKDKHLAGEYLAINKSTIEQLPIVKVDQNKQKPFIDLVDKILAITQDSGYLKDPIKQAKVRDYEKQINQLVYNLYGLTRDEIKIIEGNSQKL